VSIVENIKAVKSDIERLEKAKKSRFPRQVDTVNLMNAHEKLRKLLLEAKATTIELQNKP